MAVCVANRQLSLVMEFMQGGSLYQLLHSTVALPWSRGLEIVRDMLAGLVCLHALGIIHRDLKSANVLLDEGSSGKGKLCDFGLAKTRAGAVSVGLAGTIPWLSPEALIDGRMTEASDVYAAAMVLWEVASRRLPYAQEANAVAVAARIGAGEQETIPDSTPTSVAAFIRSCWQKEPGRRPTADEALAQVEAILDSPDALPATPIPPPSMSAMPPALMSAVPPAPPTALPVPGVPPHSGPHYDPPSKPEDMLVSVAAAAAEEGDTQETNARGLRTVMSSRSVTELRGAAGVQTNQRRRRGRFASFRARVGGLFGRGGGGEGSVSASGGGSEVHSRRTRFAGGVRSRPNT